VGIYFKLKVIGGERKRGNLGFVTQLFNHIGTPTYLGFIGKNSKRKKGQILGEGVDGSDPRGMR